MKSAMRSGLDLGRLRWALLLPPLMLAACVRPSGQHVGAPSTSPSWMVGSWALKGRPCDADGTIVYRKDGSWISEGATGTWRLVGDRLRTEVTADEENPGVPVRFEDRVQLIGRDEMVAARADGTVRRMRRCPTGG